jgi:hypothetical protein
MVFAKIRQTLHYILSRYNLTNFFFESIVPYS